MRGLMRIALATWLVAVLCAPAARPARAQQGVEARMREDDVTVTFDSRWAGGHSGGYHPIRFRVENRGPSRNLTFRLSGTYETIPVVEQTIGAEQNATVRFTLLVPIVCEATAAKLQVFSDGRELEKLGRDRLSLPDPSYQPFDRPALVVISPVNVECSHFEYAVTTRLSASAASGYYGSGISEDHAVVGPGMLPETWLGYSSVDLVAIPLKRLAGLPTEYRRPLIQWVETGGTLLVYDVGEAAGESDELRDLLRLNRRGFGGNHWLPAQIAHRKRANPTATTDAYGNEIGPEPEVINAAREAYQWPAASEVFASRELMLGRVYAFPGNPFPGSIHDWNWFLNSFKENFAADRMTIANLGPLQWSIRNGLSARESHNEFLEFLIPGVDTVPVYAFLILITLFTIVIGPVNYIFFWKRKQLYMLLLTIPAIALATSVSLFAYSAISHGFGIKSRARSVTFIDQRNNTAVTQARIALWAGIAPSEGLEFSPDTAVYPIWNGGSEFQSGTVNWTESQRLTSGWLRSRTRTQFLTTSHREERSRLNVKEPSGGALAVENGLEWTLAMVLVSDSEGRLYFGSDVPAGGSAKLAPATEGDTLRMQRYVADFRPEMPPGVTPIEDHTYRGYSYGYGYGEPERAFEFRNNPMEKTIAKLAQSNVSLKPNTYFAIVSENPGVELGVEETSPRSDLHIVVGAY